MVGREVLGARALILLEKPVREYWRELKFYPFRKTAKRHVKYSAYCGLGSPPPGS